VEEGEVQKGCEIIRGSPSTTPGFTQKMLSFVHSSHIVASPKKFAIPNSLLPCHSPFIFSFTGKKSKCNKMNSEIKKIIECVKPVVWPVIVFHFFLIPFELAFFPLEKLREPSFQ